MAEMLVLTNGDLVPMAEVGRLRRCRSGMAVFDVLGHEGERLGEAREDDVDNVRGVVVPATPGWRLGYFPLPDEPQPFEFLLEPIVAWRVDGGRTIPVTVSGLGSQRYVVVAPCGHTEAPDDCAWRTLEEATASVAAEYARHKAERATS